MIGDVLQDFARTADGVSYSASATIGASSNCGMPLRTMRPDTIPAMRKARYLLAFAAFVGLAVAFDGFGVAAIFVEFRGIERLLLAIVCIVAGTVSAFLVSAQLFRVIARRHVHDVVERARRRL